MRGCNIHRNKIGIPHATEKEETSVQIIEMQTDKACWQPHCEDTRQQNMSEVLNTLRMPPQKCQGNHGLCFLVLSLSLTHSLTHSLTLFHSRTCPAWHRFCLAALSWATQWPHLCTMPWPGNRVSLQPQTLKLEAHERPFSSYKLFSSRGLLSASVEGESVKAVDSLHKIHFLRNKILPRPGSGLACLPVAAQGFVFLLARKTREKGSPPNKNKKHRCSSQPELRWKSRCSLAIPVSGTESTSKRRPMHHSMIRGLPSGRPHAATCGNDHGEGQPLLSPSQLFSDPGKQGNPFLGRPF